MEYKITNCNSYNIHTIKTDKFKTIRMEIIFSKEVEKEKMPIFTFLADILSDSCKKYPHRKDIAIKLEELYKTSFYSISNKVGNLFTITFVLEFIDPLYINDPHYLEEVLAFPFTVINNPLVHNKEFDLTSFNIVKRRIKEEIESINDNSDKKALLNALKTMDNNSVSASLVLGNLDDLNTITPTNLYNAYLDLLEHFRCDIFLIGNLNVPKSIEIIKNNFKNRVIKFNKVNMLVHNKTRNKVVKEISTSKFIQSTLVMIYNIKDLNKDEKNIAFHVFNYLLGSGGINSKLYKNLRTDNSLCYGVRSLYLKYDELFIVLVSLDKSNLKKAEALIKKSISEMIKGAFSEEDVCDAIKNLTFSLKLGLDINTSILNNYIFNYFDNLPLVEERIKLLKKVNKNDLIKCGKSLLLNTIYVQESEIDGVKNGRN